MLKKLLKYDVFNIYKGIITFYLLAFFFALLTRLFLSIENSTICLIIGQICSGVTISMIINIVINNVLRAWGMFRRSVYGDESYLTHTLPIDKNTIFASKTIAGIITMLTSVATIFITLFIAYYSQEIINEMKATLALLATASNSTVIRLVIVICLLFFLEMILLLELGNLGMIKGHQKNNHKIVYSVIYTFLYYLTAQLIVVATLFMSALFNQDIMNLFCTNEMIHFEAFKILMYTGNTVYLIGVVVTYWLGRKELSKGVNIE